ncbi:MAG TPA: hypothetical protein VN081_03140 [Dongiaceae bacterium]|nr:hypothetical protein [Dongiaceae bacterium]
MTRLEFPEPPSEPKKKVERLAFGDPAPSKRLFNDTSSDPFKMLYDEMAVRFPNFTGQQLLYGHNLMKQLVPLTEPVLAQFGARAQEAQADFTEKLAKHTKKMELGEVAKLISKATEAAAKPKTFFSKFLHEGETDWSSYKALGLHLQTELNTIQSGMMFISGELSLQKDRLPVHLASLSVVLDKHPPTDQDLLQLADNRRRALTFGVQQAGLLHNQVKQMNATLATIQENLNTFLKVTLPALELKASLE